MSVSAELQKLVIDTLKADSAVSAIVGTDVYDHAPSSNPFPRITMGASDATPDDADCVNGQEVNLQVDCWSRDDGNLHPCRALVDAAREALHEANVSLPDPYALVSIRVPLTRVAQDPDGITAHGIVNVRALVETT